MVVALLFAGIYLVRNASEPSTAPPAPEPVPVPAQPVPAPSPSPKAQPPQPAPAPMPLLPSLHDSDPFVLDWLGAFDLPSAWTQREDLVRRLAVIIDNAPRGDYPHRQLGFLAPATSFKVIRRGDEIYLDPANYDRYKTHLDVLERVSPEMLADLLVRLEPLLRQALGELGNRRGVLAQIRDGAASIIALEALPGDVRLVQPNVFYQFADPRLESLSPLHKQALRLGPENLTRLQRYLAGLQAALANAR